MEFCFVTLQDIMHNQVERLTEYSIGDSWVAFQQFLMRLIT